MSKVAIQIKKAKNYYFNEWKGNEKICPAFGEKVYITRLGWNHIVYHPRRNLVDKMIRLKNLNLARNILEKATIYQTIEKRGKYYYFGIRAIEGERGVTVVVTSKGKKGRKIFYSVMLKNLRRQRQYNRNKRKLKNE